MLMTAWYIIGGTVRGRKERRYLTEKYQQKQVRLAYTFVYDKPYDRHRYIRTEFARKRRFYDILRGNYVQHKYWHSEQWMLSQSGNTHKIEPWELGRYRNHSFDDCGRARCPGCSNPRRGHTGDKEVLTMQERKAKLQYVEEMREYKESRNEKVKSIIAR